MANQRTINIDPLSARSLLIQAEVNGNALSTATGFIVEWEGQPFLITNWHVVTGRDPGTDKLLSKTAGIPDSISIVHHSSKQLGAWVVRQELLYSDGNSRWIEHVDGQKIDVVALPLTETDSDITIYAFDLKLGDVDMIVEPAMPVSIIGYPYGLATAGAWPIWKTGHVASDPDLDYDGRPAFLIDATTRGGMSGSPVVLRLHGGYRTSENNYIMAGGTSTRFLGVYSGRIHGQAELGRVWRPLVIPEILRRYSAPNQAPKPTQ